MDRGKKVKRYEKTEQREKKAKYRCIRQIANWSKLENKYKFDHAAFHPKELQKDLSSVSPKMLLLLDTIKKIDEQDMKNEGKLYKHVIFSDVKYGYGAKIICSSLLAYDKKLIYDQKMKIKKPLPHGTENMALLTSSITFGRNFPARLKASIKNVYNQRPDNIHGDKLRFLIIDSDFKEGIDLYDVKYFHLFEPQLSKADQQQVIGRATRTCGQAGLRFIPDKGWPLYVKIYDTEVPEHMQDVLFDTKTLHELYVKKSNVHDLEKMNLSDELVQMAMTASVDYPLNINVHHFQINPFPEDGLTLFGNLKEIVKKWATFAYKKAQYMYAVKNKKDAQEKIEIPDNNNIPYRIPDEYMKKSPLRYDKQDVENTKTFVENSLYTEIQPNIHTGSRFLDFRFFIQHYFFPFAWEKLKLENKCIPPADNAKETGNLQQKEYKLIQFSPSQDFLSHYFHPKLDIKGMLLYHSVGTGKTCAAIATATRNFETNGYTILWVTRSSLKREIWKNMFHDVCHVMLREDLKNKKRTPWEIQERKKALLGDAWFIEPISYKQFSNLLLARNKYNEMLVRKNGIEDPLQKTLLIIDEAHKLYSRANDLKTTELPNMEVMYDRIMHSYHYSGQDSVRLLLMTATPFTNDPMEMIQLLNLLKMREDALPTDFDTFKEQFLDKKHHGKFSKNGAQVFLNKNAGQISYLDQGRDARKFAQPILEHKIAPLSLSDRQKQQKDGEKGKKRKDGKAQEARLQKCLSETS